MLLSLFSSWHNHWKHYHDNLGNLLSLVSTFEAPPLDFASLQLLDEDTGKVPYDRLERKILEAEAGKVYQPDNHHKLLQAFRVGLSTRKCSVESSLWHCHDLWDRSVEMKDWVKDGSGASEDWARCQNSILWVQLCMCKCVCVTVSDCVYYVTVSPYVRVRVYGRV